MKTNSIDLFFAVPAQAFQTDFNDNFARYQQRSEKQAIQGRQSLMEQLSGLQRLFLFAPLVLLAIAIAVWFAMAKWVISPLRRLIVHINQLAAGICREYPLTLCVLTVKSASSAAVLPPCSAGSSNW